ncbi:MAG: nucleotide exchange factor GrpE [Dehalococcoidia bacterium]|nr:nucleotide exchange factor GrpE [Dehalococcoidia bacterium]
MTEDRQPDIQDLEEQFEEDADDASDLQERLEEAERERDQFRTLALRYKADLENYKKRAASEMDETRERANAQLLLKLIGVADDFNRALDYVPDDSSDAGWVEGLRLTQRSIENAMQTEGLSRIEAAIGQPFDVYEHEAVFFEPTNEVAEGTVVRVVRNGYRLKNRVLRAAQVSVAQAIQPQENTESEIQNQEAQ